MCFCWIRVCSSSYELLFSYLSSIYGICGLNYEFIHIPGFYFYLYF